MPQLASISLVAFAHQRIVPPLQHFHRPPHRAGGLLENRNNEAFCTREHASVVMSMSDVLIQGRLLRRPPAKRAYGRHEPSHEPARIIPGRIPGRRGYCDLGHTACTGGAITMSILSLRKQAAHR